MKKSSSYEETYSPMKHHSHSEIFIENEEAGVQAQLIETQPQEPRQPINRCHRCVRNIPYFTLIQSLLVAIFYSLGIYGIVGTKIDLSLQPLGLHGPQSPSCIGSDKLCQYEYFKVGSFPDCAEARSQYYRLFSYQYAHGGLQHIGQNLISLLGFGAALESVVGPWFTFLFYETGGVFGALLWSWAYPFEGIVGCSCGIYGIIGGLVAFCILKPESMSHRAHIALAIAMAAQVLSDILTYVVWYNPTVAWLGHLGGLNSGLLLGLSFGLASKDKQIWKLALGWFSLASLFLYMTYLFYHTYSPKFPNTVLRFNPTVIHSYNKGFCCYELSQLANSTYLLSQAKQDYVCIQSLTEGDRLVKISH